MINTFKQDYEAKHQKILNNKDLTPQGKQKALDKLAQEKREAARILIRELRNNAIMAAATLKDIQDARDKQTEEALKNLDYERLNYEALSIRNKILAADSIFEVIEAWENDLVNGDPYVIKAWKDTATEPLVAKGKDGLTEEKAKLIQSIAKAPVNLVEDPELTETEKEVGRLLQETHKNAAALDGEFNDNAVIIKRVMAGIKFSKGKIELDFEPRVAARFDDGDEVMESVKQMAKRVEKEYQEKAQEYIKWAKEKFDVDLDPDFNDLLY